MVIVLDFTIAEKEIKDMISHSQHPEILHNVVDFLYDNFDNYSWVGIYIVKENYLILGPWRGKQATEHTKIPIGQGICGSAVKSCKTEVVDDVSEDGRYLSCFISTRSEIVVPIKKEGIVIGEIDIDSDVSKAFNKSDVTFLEKVADMLTEHI
ncbi:MAG: GAF domain-containing protein [Thermoplasmata archaeon]|nr:MAG: GAF domain-containing protein [Thermoplasmata archaeon]